MIRAAILAAALALPTLAEAQPIRCDRFGCSEKSAFNRQIPSVSAGYAARPTGCPPAWCGCWLAIKKLGLTPAQSRRRGLWLARNWAREGRRIARPFPGAIAIYRRGRRGGHVGIIRSVPRPGTIVLLSGNDGGRVRERLRSTAGVIAYVVL